MEWTWPPEKTIALIHDYKANKILWDGNHPEYKKNRGSRLDIIKRLAHKYEVSVIDIKKKIKNLRSAFHRENNLIRRLSKSGVRYARKTKPWAYYSLLLFLKDVDKEKKVLSSEDEIEYSQEELDNISVIKQEPDTEQFQEHVGSHSSQNASTNCDLIESRHQQNDQQGYPPDECVEPPKEAYGNWRNDVRDNSNYSEYRDECLTYGEYIGNELRRLQPRTQTIVKHLINNIVFQAALGKFDSPAIWEQLSSQSVDYSGSQFIPLHFMECASTKTPNTSAPNQNHNNNNT